MALNLFSTLTGADPGGSWTVETAPTATWDLLVNGGSLNGGCVTPSMPVNMPGGDNPSVDFTGAPAGVFTFRYVPTGGTCPVPPGTFVDLNVTVNDSGKAVSITPQNLLYCTVDSSQSQVTLSYVLASKTTCPVGQPVPSVPVKIEKNENGAGWVTVINSTTSNPYVYNESAAPDNRSIYYRISTTGACPNTATVTTTSPVIIVGNVHAEVIGSPAAACNTNPNYNLRVNMGSGSAIPPTGAACPGPNSGRFEWVDLSAGGTVVGCTTTVAGAAINYDISGFSNGSVRNLELRAINDAFGTTCQSVASLTLTISAPSPLPTDGTANACL